MKGKAPIRLLLVSIGLALTYKYAMQVQVPHYGMRQTLHDSILAGTADSPYRYRVLVPYLMEGLTRLFDLVTTRKNAFLAAYSIYDAVVFNTFVLTLFAFLRRWYSKGGALVATLFFVALMPLAFFDHGFQPWSWLEAALFPLGLLLLYERKAGWFALVSLIAVLNRETGIFLPLTAVIVAWFSRRDASPQGFGFPVALGTLAACIGILVGLRLGLGQAEHVHTLGSIAKRNLSGVHLGKSIPQIALFLGIAWTFLPAGIRQAHPFLRRVAWILIPYGGSILVFGIWKEVRLLVPLAPLLLALALARFEPWTASRPDGEGAAPLA